MDTQITEFELLDPDRVDAVTSPANGIGFLMLKSLDEPAFSDDGLVKYVSAAARRKYAESGVAMPTGAFPIPDEGHLRSAIGRLAEYQGDKAKAKAHIIKRARALHLTHLLPKDWNVSKDAQKDTAPDKSVPRSEAEDQTDEHLEGDPEAGTSPDPEDGGTPTHQGLGDVKPSETTGQGDTAPDKSVPRGEAESQTPGAQKAYEPDTRLPDAVNGTGAAAPDGEEEAERARSEAGRQTDEVEKDAAASDPGSSAWEARDVALGEHAEELISQLAEVVRTFTEREKAEGGASKELRRAARVARSLLTNPKKLRKVAPKMPDTSELVKVLGEYDSARRAEKKAKRAEAKKAAEKAERKAAKAATKAAKAAGSADDDRLAKALEDLNSMKETVEKMASEDGKHVVLNGAALTAVLRDPAQRDGVFKQFDATFEAAKEAYEKNPSQANRSALTQAGQRRMSARLIAGESVRSNSLEALARTQKGMGNPLFASTTTHGLIDDTAIEYRN